MTCLAQGTLSEACHICWLATLACTQPLREVILDLLQSHITKCITGIGQQHQAVHWQMQKAMLTTILSDARQSIVQESSDERKSMQTQAAQSSCKVELHILQAYCNSSASSSTALPTSHLHCRSGHHTDIPSACRAMFCVV